MTKIDNLFLKDGKLHRERDLPAIIEYDENGQLKFERWYKNDEQHRESDLPAYMEKW